MQFILNKNLKEALDVKTRLQLRMEDLISSILNQMINTSLKDKI